MTEEYNKTSVLFCINCGDSIPFGSTFCKKCWEKHKEAKQRLEIEEREFKSKI